MRRLKYLLAVMQTISTYSQMTPQPPHQQVLHLGPSCLVSHFTSTDDGEKIVEFYL